MDKDSCSVMQNIMTEKYKLDLLKNENDFLSLSIKTLSFDFPLTR